MPMFEDFLKKMGLNTNEALVYGTLLRQSPLGASFIAKKCHLPRSSVYTVLNTLLSKGLVGTTYKNEVKQFVAEDLSVLKSLLTKEQKQIQTKLDTYSQLEQTLQSFTDTTQIHIPQIIFFEGQEGLKSIYLSMVRQARKHATMYLLRDEFVWKKEWSFIFETEWHQRMTRWKKEKNIKTKLLVNPSALEKKKDSFYKTKKETEVRYLSEVHQIKEFALYIMEDTVSIMSMDNQNLVGIKITNKHIAENFVQMFLSHWDQAKK